MYYQTGSMRDINNDFSPVKNTIVYDRQNEFQYAQRSKYEKSQASYIQHQKTKVIYQEVKSNSAPKNIQNKQLFYYVPIKIKSPDRQDYTSTLKIQLLTRFQKNNNCTKIHITNDNDSLFLWSFSIRESEFLNLKNQQSLRVDFHDFPELVQQFLGCCDKTEKQGSQNRVPQFYAVLDIKKGTDQAEFKILQSNKYKQSLHLSLKFKKANDQQAKIFLAEKYDQQRRQNTRLSSQLKQTQYKLNQRMQQIQKRHAQFQIMQRQKNQRISELQRRQRQKIKQLTLRIQQQNLKKNKQQNEKNNKYVSDLNEKIQQLKYKNSEYISNLQKANEKIINLQGSQATLKTKNSILQQRCESIEKINMQLKANQLKNQQQIHTLSKQNTKLTCTIQSLQDKLKQRDQRLSQNIQVKSNNYNQINNLQENLRQEKQKNTKLQQKNESFEAQISKLQKKNQDLFNKYQKKKDKIADYKQILTMQQQKIGDFQKQQRKMIQQILQLKRQRENSQRLVKDRQIKIKDLTSSLSQKQQYIQDNKKIISDLNKRLNQKSIGGMGIKNMSIPSTLPTYVGFSSTANIGRDFSSTISSTSESRIKYSPSPISTSPINEKLSERIAPPFRKYRQGIQNDKDQQNSHAYHSHSRSPIVNKLNQQQDPEQGDRTKEKIGPIKFKK